MAAVRFDQLAGVAVSNGYVEKQKAELLKYSLAICATVLYKKLFQMSLWNRERELMIVDE